MNSLDKFIQFISTGIFTPFAYLLYVIFMIIATFLIGLPIGLGIYFIQMAMHFILEWINIL